MKRKWQGAVSESLTAGINLVGTKHAGKSAAELRRDNPALAVKWAWFITTNKAALVADIAGRVR